MSALKRIFSGSVGNASAWVAGALLCYIFAFFFSGCGRTDQALTIPVMGDDTVQDQIAMPDDAGEETQQEMIWVYVCGAVRTPGVVQLAAGSRGQDALDAAGGFAPEADRETVNLAAVVTDGQKLYFPSEDEQWDSGAEGIQTANGLVNINTADVSRLCTLPGIGESRARMIIAYREEKGAFAKPEDIMKVSGIKEGAYAKIKDLICVN